MDFGVGLIFPGKLDSDQRVYREQVALARTAEDLGYDSVWVTEHHFSSYQMTPDPLQLQTYIAGATKRIKLGTNAVILPWNDPTRVAERISILDNLSDGRFLLGIGRGLGVLEFEGLAIPMAESRGRFLESAAMVRDALESGFIESKGDFYPRERREIRPRPIKGFAGRRWAVAVSPESFGTVAELGFGLLCQPQKKWSVIERDTAGFWAAHESIHGVPPIPSVTCAFVYCDADPVKARDEGQRLIGEYHDEVSDFYGLAGDGFANKPGYEFYAKGAQRAQQAGQDVARDFYVSVQVYGTPDECMEKIAELRKATRCGTFVGNFHYASLDAEQAKGQLRLFAEEVIPRLRPLPKQVA
jgi:alkanesulfonate monooxygenase SsuD/methylene tetrahydromethanopterin reductase-like flavin-dependent oxidoreductase (luciferase family)